MRTKAISESMMEALLSGELKPLLEAVQQDDTLCMELRGDSASIYYRGGEMLRITEKPNSYEILFNRNYCLEEASPPAERPDVETAVCLIPQYKHTMDLWCRRYRGYADEVQQVIQRENNTRIAPGMTRLFAPRLAALSVLTQIVKNDIICAMYIYKTSGGDLMRKPLLSTFLSALLTLALCLSLLPAPARAATIHTLDNDGDLRALLSQSNVVDGDTIVLSGTGKVNDTYNDSAPWVIDKAVTIKGGSIELRGGGILLGADVTFENVTLEFANRVRSAIMANGHTLTLNNVSRSSSTTPVHLFCGGLTGHTTTANAGEHGQIILQGSTALGNVYAGSLSSDGVANSFTAPASIIMEAAFTGSTGNIYSCGAIETLVDQDKWFDTTYVPDPPTPSPERYPATGGVSIQINNMATSANNRAVDGKTGGDTNADVTFVDNGKGYSLTATLTNLGGLTLAPGDSGATLVPTADSSFDRGAPLTLPAGGILNLTNLADPAFGDFTGGGVLVLGADQSVQFSGSVSETTTVALKEYFNGSGGALATDGHPYITAPESTQDSFTLAPYNGITGALTRGQGGVWTAGSGEGTAEVLLTSLTVQSPDPLPADNEGGVISLTAVYQAQPEGVYLEQVPVAVTVNGVEMERYWQGSYYMYYPTYDDAHKGLDAMCFFYDDDTQEPSEWLEVWGTGMTGSAYALLPGSRYVITLTVPGEFMVDGADETVSFTLEVEDVEIIPGDVNGDGVVTIADGVLAQRIARGDMSPTADQQTAADLDESGTVDEEDVRAICRLVVGLDGED